jgi:type I restriction enzyme S subunit
MKFSDFVTLQRGFDLPKKNMLEGDIPVVGSTSIIGHHNVAKVTPPGVCTGRSGSLGEVQFIDRPFWPHNTSLWVKDFKGNDARFVYYCLKSLDLGRFNAGAGVPTLNRNHLNTLYVNVPDLPTQKKIAGILSAYDDLIENNLRRIAILEEMAQSLYREWFVHFRFPGHESVKMIDSPLGPIPEGWEVKKLGEYSELTMGLSPKGNTYNSEGHGMPLVNGPVEFSDRFTKAIKWTSAPNKISKEGDLIVCVRGSTTGKHVKSDGVYCLGRGVCSLSCEHQSFLDHLFKQELPALLAMTNGSTFPSWTGPLLKNHPILVPPLSLIEKFVTLGSKLNSQIQTLDRKNQNLRKTRDLLSPKLLKSN